MLLSDTPRNGSVGARPARVTINALAEALGLTKGTVSRALNGYPDISDSTRRRVERMAQKMGYAPLAHAQAIRSGRVRALGLVLQVGEPDAQRPFLADFLAGVTTAASAERWSLTVATGATEAEALETMSRLIDERKADGFILPRTRTDDARIDLLRGAGVPFVLYGRTGDTEGCAWFDILGEDAMAQAVERLHALGHRRIGYVGGGAGFHYTRLRLEGFREACVRLGLADDGDLILSDAVTREAGARAGTALLSRPEPPTAIVCATDLAALGVCAAGAALGLAIGRDLSVISYDGVPEGAYAEPPLTTFEVDTREAGARLAALLIRRIRGEAPEDLRETAHARLLVRGSDGPPALTSTALAARIAGARTQSSDIKGRT